MTPASTQPAANPRMVVQLGIVVVACLVMILNETTFSVALPQIMGDFHVEADVVQWLSTAFLLTTSLVIPMTGYLIQRFTTRRLFAASVLLFALGCTVGAAAPAFWVLLLGRIIQACGTAVIIPLMITITLAVVEPRRLGFMMGITSVVISVAPALGPTFSGFILHVGTWHWLLIIMLGLVALVGAAGFVGLRNVGETRVLPLDVPSVFLCAFTFGFVVYALTSASRIFTEGSYLPVLWLAVGFGFAAVFIKRQLRLQRDDLAFLDLRPFAIPNFGISVFMIFVVMGFSLGVANLMPIYLTRGLGISTVVVGMMLFPGGLLQGISAPIVGKLYDSVGPRPLVLPGAILMLAAMVGLYLVGTTQVRIVACLMVLNIGIAMVNSPTNALAMASLPERLVSHGSASLNSLQQLGGAAGTAVLIGALTVGAGGSTEHAAPTAITAGAHAAFLLAAGVAVVLLVCAPLLKRLHHVEDSAAPANKAGSVGGDVA